MSRKILLSRMAIVGFAMFSLSIGSAAEKRHHDAHVHGVAEVNFAVEGSKADVEFRAPAESIMGFEHEAKNESDRKKRDAALRTVQTKMQQMVVFDPKLDCKFSEVKAEIVEEKETTSTRQAGKTGHAHTDQKKAGEHREVHAAFSVACAKPLAGSRVRFGVYKVFPPIQEIKVQVLGDAKQSGATIKKDTRDVRF